MKPNLRGKRGRCRGRDHMVVGFTTTCEVESVLDTTLCDKVC